LLDVVEPLQQHEQAGFPASGLTNQPDPLPGLNAEAEFVEHLNSTGILERDVVEGDGGATLYQRLGLRMVAQLMWKQQRSNRFGQAGEMLGNIDQRHGEIARGTQDAKSQRADQHDVAGAGAAALPKHDRPDEQGNRQHHRDRGVRDPQLLEVTQAASPRR